MDENRPSVIGVSFLAQAWKDQERIAEVTGLSYDAARHVAQSFTLTGHTGRIMSEDSGTDWTEVFDASGGFRCGPFARTVLVRG